VGLFLYRAVDRDGKNVDFGLSFRRDVAAARRSFARQSRAKLRVREPSRWTVMRNRIAQCAR
jgi:transposase-like protein